MTTARLNDARVDELRSAVEDIVKRRSLASCQYALALDGEVVVNETVGDAPPESRYRIFSVTKLIPVAVVWQLIGEGRLDPEAPVATWWPEFGKYGKDAVTLEHVLGHTAGLAGHHIDRGAWEDRDERVRQMVEWQLDWEPGTNFEYHALSAHWILAELITRVTGTEHRQAARERLLDPLGLDRLELGVPVGRQADVQPLVETGEVTSREAWAEVLGEHVLEMVRDLIPTEPTALEDDVVISALSSQEGLRVGVPGGGAVSDAASVALLYQALLHNQQELWDPKTLRKMVRTVVNRHPTFLGHPVMRGYGTEISGEGEPHERLRRLGSGFTSPTAFGHAGAGGQVSWGDPETGLSFAFFTNGWDHDLLATIRRERVLNEHVTRCLAP